MEKIGFCSTEATEKIKKCHLYNIRKNLTDEFSILHNKFKLPKIKGVETSFTDAILVGDQIYFLATAEATESTYHDGEVLGSIIGQIDVTKMKLKSHKIISKTNKLEGITLVEETPETISLLICEDNDTEVLESNIYKITLKNESNFKQNLFLVKEKIGMFKASNNYDIFDPENNHQIMTTKEVGLGFLQKCSVLPIINATHLSML